MRRSSPDSILTGGFREAGLSFFHYDGPRDGAPLTWPPYNAACWLKQHDPLDRPCSEDHTPLEALHFIGRQAIRRILSFTLRTGFVPGGVDPDDVEDLIELAEWDPRNAGLGCIGHHRRLDSHQTPELRLDASVLPVGFLDFVLDWGFESEAEGRFAGDVSGVLAQRRGERGDGLALVEDRRRAASRV